MSRHAQKLATPVAILPDGELSLAQRLQAAGIMVPDQKRARHVMEACRLGFEPDVSPWRMRAAFFRQIFYQWMPFGYDEYYADLSTQTNWGGGSLPQTARELADKVRKAVPEVELTIYAKYTDPWLCGRLPGDAQELIFIGWVYVYDGSKWRPVELL